MLKTIQNFQKKKKIRYAKFQQLLKLYKILYQFLLHLYEIVHDQRNISYGNQQHKYETLLSPWRFTQARHWTRSWLWIRRGTSLGAILKWIFRFSSNKKYACAPGNCGTHGAVISTQRCQVSWLFSAGTRTRSYR